MQILISPKKIAIVLAGVITLLTIFSIVGAFGKYYYFNGSLQGLVRLFNMEEEASVPTWYAAFSLLACAALLGWIALGSQQTEARFVRHWFTLALIFIFLSLDEIIQFHELTVHHVTTLLNVDGFFRYSWIIPAALFVLVLSILYIKFLLHLSAKTRTLFFIAAALYVGGAIGVEALEGQYDTLYGTDSIGMDLLIAIEEFMEMAGVAVFLYALLSYLSISAGFQKITFAVGER